MFVVPRPWFDLVCTVPFLPPRRKGGSRAAPRRALDVLLDVLLGYEMGIMDMMAGAAAYALRPKNSAATAKVRDASFPRPRVARARR